MHLLVPCGECKHGGTESVGMPHFTEKAIMRVDSSVSYVILFMGPVWIFMLLDKASTQAILIFQPSKGSHRVSNDTIFGDCRERKFLLSSTQKVGILSQ